MVKDLTPIDTAIGSDQALLALKTFEQRWGEHTARKLIYLTIQNAAPQCTQTRGCTKALLAFGIQFRDRIPD